MNNNVKERPILFSADMIRALLQEYSMPGQYKNQTRRTRGLNRFNNFPEHLKERGWEIQEFLEVDPGLWVAISKDDEGDFPDDFNPWVRCPYGKAGDRLWVRETFSRYMMINSGPPGNTATPPLTKDMYMSWTRMEALK